MKIDHKTMLFTDISPEERKEMTTLVQDIVLNGTMPHPIPQWVVDWLEAFDLNSADRRLLVMSTAFPQRALLSLVLESNKSTD